MSSTPERPPLLAGLLFLSTVGLWSTSLLVGATTLAEPTARSAGAAAWLAGIVTLVGLLLARGRWAQRVGLGLVAATAIPAAFTGSWILFAVGVMLAAATGVALLVDPVRGWIRPGRSMDAPPDAAVVVMVILVLWPLAGSALASSPLGLLMWLGPLGAFWYGRANQSGLWAVRVGGVVPVVAAIGADWQGWLVGGVLAALTAWWAWQPGTRLAVVPLVSRPSSGVCPTPDFDRLLRGIGDAG